MVHKAQKIWREFANAGPLNTLIPVFAFVDDHIFLTKTGDLGIAFRVRGVDYECLDPEQVDYASRRFEAALRGLTEEFRLYQYLLKRDQPAIPHRLYDSPIVNKAIQGRMTFLTEHAKELYSLDLYFVLLYEGLHTQTDLRQTASTFAKNPVSALKERLVTHASLVVLDDALDRARQSLQTKAETLLIQIRDFLNTELLRKDDVYRFLARLTNYAPYRSDAMRLKFDGFLDQQLAGSALECHRDHLQLDEFRVRVLSVTEPPSQTFANMLHALMELPSNAIVVTEWKRASSTKIRKLIRSKRRHHHNSKTSLLNYMQDGPQSERTLLIDDSNEAVVHQLGQSLKEMEIEGNYFGEWSMTVVLYDADLRKLDSAAAECVKVFATHDATVIEERYNMLNAWLAVLPGNRHYNLRHLWLLNTNCADLSLIFTLGTGEQTCRHLSQEYLAVLETNHGTPYYLNLHYEDIAHTLILGATGSGKSFLVNFLITNLQKYQPYTFIFDLGGGYESLTQLFGGAYLKIGVESRPITINPFSLPPTKENLHFLFSFVRVLIESGSYTLTSADERDLYGQIESMYEIEPCIRRLFTLQNILNRNLAQHLHKWTGDGPYASLFDNVADSLTFSRFQCFDFEGMDQYRQALEPLLFYILHRANAHIHALDLTTTFKVFIIDEAWRFFRNPAIRQYIVEALKTWRKRNAAMVLATQSGDDLERSELLDIIVESCATRMFLANPYMDRTTYREVFHLNETEAALIAQLIPKQQILVKRPDLAKVVNLRVDATGYWLYTNSPYDNARRRDVFAQHGFEHGLEILSKESPR